jgi:undecaprenyl-diphosphatase
MALDIQFFYLLNGLAGQSPLLDRAIVFFASDLAYVLVALFLILLLFSQYAKREKLRILLVTALSGAVALGITEVIRFFYNRQRPYLALHIHPLFTDTASSFPSAHATFFFAMATAVYLYNKKWGIIFFIAAILMTVSRVIAGIHYPSDVIGGAIIGIAVAYATFYYARRIEAKRAHQTY